MQFECFVQFLNDTGKRFSNLQRRKTKLKDLTLQFGKVEPYTVQSYMGAEGLTNIEQCPYSPDLNMCDWFLFTRLQEHCRMQHYGSTEELKMDTQRFLRQLPKSLLLRELEKLKSIAKLWFGSPESILHHSVFHFVCSCLFLCFNIM